MARVYCGRCNGPVFQHKMGAGQRQADACSLWLKGAQLSDSIIMCWQPNATRYVHIRVVSDSNGQSLLLTATGYAYGLKLSGSKNCVCTYFGDGSAQTGDSHAAMNFAPTLGCPVVFFW